jgi:hypothetical protein
MMRRLTALTSALIIAALTACTAPSAPRDEATGPAPTQQTCSQRQVPFRHPKVRAVAFARGDGPVYVGLGTGGEVRYREDTQEHEGWYYYKTLWAVAPRYEGQVNVTGHQLDGPNQLMFGTGPFPGTKLKALEMPPDSSGGWRYGPSATLIRAPGCYAFEIEGEGFRQVVTFVAVL